MSTKAKRTKRPKDLADQVAEHLEKNRKAKAKAAVASVAEVLLRAERQGEDSPADWPARRWVAFVDETFFVEGHGYRVAIVREGEDGYHPTGQWPNDGTGVMPWFWGQTITEARECCRLYNARRGISDEDAFRIVAASINRGLANQERA